MRIGAQYVGLKVHAAVGGNRVRKHGKDRRMKATGQLSYAMTKLGCCHQPDLLNICESWLLVDLNWATS